jgi:phenolic acid decarboxylase
VWCLTLPRSDAPISRWRRNKPGTKSEAGGAKEQQELLGKTLKFEYASETYRIDVLDETSVRWTRVAGEDAGRGDTERYVYSRLSEEIGLITWVEADGLGLSNALNFTAGVVATHANEGREVFENPGKLTVSE